MKRLWLVCVLNIVSCQGPNDVAPGSVLWETELEGTACSAGHWIATSPVDDAVLVVSEGDDQMMLSYLNSGGSLCWQVPTVGSSAWFDQAGNANTLYEKFDSEGQLIKSYPTTEDYSSFRAAVDATGKIYAWNQRLVCMNAKREELWSWDIALDWGSIPPAVWGKEWYGVAVDDENNLFVVGSAGGLYGDYCPDEASAKLLRKYNPQDDEEWTKCYTSADGATVSNKIAIDSQGDLLFIATRDQPADGDGQFAWLVSRSDPEGNERWVREIGDSVSGPSYVSHLSVDGADNLIVIGEILGRTPEVSLDIWIAKYDREANELWTTTIETPYGQDDLSVFATADSSGDILVIGTLNASGLEDSDIARVWVGKIAG